MALLLSIPILGLAVMLQVAAFSRLTLLSGSADLLLLIVASWALQERVRTGWHWAIVAGVLFGLVSGLPWLVPISSYLLVVLLARLLTRRIWQAPLLAMFLIVTVGTLVLQTLSLLVLRVFGDPLPFGDSFGLVILPSLLLNLLLAIPVHSLLRDLAKVIYPQEVER